MTVTTSKTDPVVELRGLLAAIADPSSDVTVATHADLLRDTYERAVHRLAEARASQEDPESYRELNDMVARVARLLYSGPVMTNCGVLLWMRREILSQIRASRGFLAAAALILAGGFLVGFGSIHTESKIVRLIIPPESLVDVDNYIFHGGALRMPELLKAQFLFRHVETAVLAIGTGLLAGIGPALVLFWMGLTTGALLSVHFQTGFFTHILGWFLPLGLPGMAIVWLAGAAGLKLGWALVDPGIVSRRVAVAQAGRFAGAVTLLVLMLLIVEFALCPILAMMA